MYASEEAFRAALNERIRQAAKAEGLSHNDLARRFALQQFVSRLFTAEPDAFVVTGGTALQFRTSEARPTSDVDLAVTREIADMQSVLIRAAQRRPGEHGEFAIEVRAVNSSPGVYTGRITYKLNGVRYAVAKIDIASHRELPEAPDLVAPDPVIGIDDTWPLPAVSTYPVAAHLADKLGAWHERHDGQPSTRAHDLADVVLLSRSCAVRAEELRDAIAVQERRRGIAIPATLSLPSPQWRKTYRSRVSQSRLPERLHDAEVALREANVFLGPILSGQVTAGMWNPVLGTWELT
ncbi:Nucleotidyl transferase of uncharacterised function (DUF1814) [Mycobacteroides abscessus subsp. massiliense]|nr:Nucleotidyl transferase of uncharacterised function (DUF1814) [Mycobacteroides abscessus subsp. massiliense]